MTVGSASRGVQPAWLLLCGTLAAGLALWSLYVVGLLVLTMMAIALARVPKSPRLRVASLLTMLVGFEGAITSLAALYWFAWGRRDGGFYVYLLVLAAAGATVLSLALWASSRKTGRLHR
jgi:uncharacterized membrane protein YeaQ/YmgE (transglycosylase-associated protein family)